MGNLHRSCWSRSYCGHRSGSHCHSGQIAPYLKTEVVSFKTEFLDIAV